MGCVIGKTIYGACIALISARGGGGITICEVVVYTGPEFGLVIEPCSDEEVRGHVNDFVEHILRGTAGNEDAPTNPDADSQGIAKEVERAIRNMAKLGTRKVTVDGKTTRIDTAKELAAE